jgi:hypothetical protein
MADLSQLNELKDSPLELDAALGELLDAEMAQTIKPAKAKAADKKSKKKKEVVEE